MGDLTRVELIIWDCEYQLPWYMSRSEGLSGFW